MTTAVCATNPSPESHSSTPSHQFRKPPTRPAYGAAVSADQAHRLGPGGAVAARTAPRRRPTPSQQSRTHPPTSGRRAGRESMMFRMVLQQNEEANGAAAPAPLTVTAPVPYAPSGSVRNPFPPIADYAFLSDCENTCLISSAGSVEWLCVPRPDSPSVFGAILDRGAGHFRLAPYGVTVPSARRYLPGSLIMETTWQTHTGWLIVRDALVMGPWHDIDTRSRTHRRTPMDWDAEHILLRTVRCVSGTVELVMNCEPSFDYARVNATWEYSASAYGEAIARSSKNPEAHPTLRLTTNLRIGLEGHE